MDLVKIEAQQRAWWSRLKRAMNKLDDLDKQHRRITKRLAKEDEERKAMRLAKRASRQLAADPPPVVDVEKFINATR